MYLRAAELGNVHALFNLGICYSDGDGIEMDIKKAFDWFAKAADHGDKTAMLRAGYCCLQLDNQKFEIVRAWLWFCRALDDGLNEAEDDLLSLKVNPQMAAMIRLLKDGDWNCENVDEVVEWIDTLKPCEIEYLMHNRPAHKEIVSLVNTLPLPIAEEIEPHVMTLHWGIGKKRKTQVQVHVKRQRRH
jgi:hypothetical protein